jgi:hypothetical protein
MLIHFLPWYFYGLRYLLIADSRGNFHKARELSCAFGQLGSRHTRKIPHSEGVVGTTWYFAKELTNIYDR